MQFVRALGRRELEPWPMSDDDSLARTLPQWLAPYLRGVRSRAALARLPLSEALLARLSAAQRRALELLAPRRIEVPSGSQLQIDYRGERAPSLAVPLQEMFGLAETPRIADGKVPVTLELLSPARRPLQITRDLGGFWRGSYAEVRRQMRGRYPKHAWPEDPLQAVPTRRPHGPRRDSHCSARTPPSRHRWRSAGGVPRGVYWLRRACSTAVSAGDSSTRCLCVVTRTVDGKNSGNPSGVPMATLSRAGGTPPEGAETTWGLQCP